MARVERIIPCLWFDKEAEAAANLYVSIFPNSKITSTTRYGEAGQEITGGTPGSVLTVQFELDGRSYTALNGGPIFKFNEAVSLAVMCDTQAEIDYYWDKLSAGGDPAAQQCGWLKDRFGLSWQVVSVRLTEMLRDPDRAKSERAMSAMLQMKKFDVAALEKAFAG